MLCLSGFDGKYFWVGSHSQDIFYRTLKYHDVKNGNKLVALTIDDLESVDPWMMLKEIELTDDCENLARFIRQNWDRVDRSLLQGLVRCTFPDATFCVDSTRRLGLKIGIASNIPSEERLRQELETIGLIQFFPVLVASGAVGVSKPQRKSSTWQPSDSMKFSVKFYS